MTSTTTTKQTKTEGPAPETMKAILVNDFIENFNEIPEMSLTMSSTENVPKLTEKNRSKELLVRVLACSLSPGDVMMLRGNMIFMHPERFPFVPGMDICGQVQDTNCCEGFERGDIVVASNGVNPVGGLAEYMLISAQQAVHKPKNVSILEAAACSSAITARNAVLDYVKEGDRVLILGGSGGVGSAAIPIAKRFAKASLVVTTSTQTEFCKNLGADVVVDYRKVNVFDMQEYQRNNKFDVIIDTIGGGNHFEQSIRVLRTKSQGGHFVAVAGDDPKPDARSWWKAIKFLASLPLRPLYTMLWPSSVPAYSLLFPKEFPEGRRQVLQWMEEGKLPIQLESQLPFSQEGVKKAFQLVAGGHAHGKVVVSLSM